MANLRNSDKHIGKNIYLASSVLYSKNVKVKERAFDILTIINRGLPEFRKVLKLPKIINFRVAPIKGSTNGRYNCDQKLVELDCRLEWAVALEVLAHELVHCEQYYTGKLKRTYVNKKGWVHSWYGEVNTSKGSTYKAYRNQPWEKEAFERQATLAETVCVNLEKKYG